MSKVIKSALELIGNTDLHLSRLPSSHNGLPEAMVYYRSIPTHF